MNQLGHFVQSQLFRAFTEHKHHRIDDVRFSRTIWTDYGRERLFEREWQKKRDVANCQCTPWGNKDEKQLRLHFPRTRNARSLGYREKENERRRRIETAKEMHDTHLVEWTDVLCSGVGFKVLQNHGFDNQSRFRGLLFGRRSRRLWRWCWRRRLFVVVDVQFRHLCLFSLRAQQQQQQRQQQKRVFERWRVSER